MTKFVGKRQHMEFDISQDITFKYIASLSYHVDEVGLILKGHLFIEHVLDEIIRNKLKGWKDILADHRTYSFAVKLQLVYSAGYLPEYLFQNIRKINKLRNNVAHNLELVLDEQQFKFVRSDGKEILLKKKKKQLYPIRRYLKLLCHGTLTQLRNHFMLEFGELPCGSEIEL